MTYTATKSLTIILKTARHLETYLAKDMSKYAINPTEFVVLEVLLNKGPQTLQSICNRVLMVNSSISYVVDSLVSKKMVIKKVNPKDKRAFLISLTKSGKTLITQIFKKHELAISKVFSTLSEVELNQMSPLVLKLGKHAAALKE
jgi:MarR family transcriptional regulator, 2-MHQ and catechol-resistance regulon repressor